MKKIFFVALFFATCKLSAQDAIEYQTPPKEIYDLVMAKPTPGVNFNSKGQYMLVLDRSSMPSVEDLAQPELRIAGLRINPNNFSPSRTAYFTSITIKEVNSGKEFAVTGLPANLKAGNLQWSPNEDKAAFTNTTNTTVDIYVIDIKTHKATKVNKAAVNLVLGAAFDWIDNNSLLYTAVNKPLSMAPKKPLAPKGPTVQENLGKVAASVTYQDLIKNPFDESQFEFYATTQLIKNNNGTETKIGIPAIYSSVNTSPDKKYLLVERIDKPFSYLVTAGGFNSTMLITDMNGNTLKQLAKLPSSELAPTGNDNVLNAPRGYNWLDNSPATVQWIEPLDSGLIKKKMDFHDAAYILAAPFTGTPKELVKTAQRMYNVTDVTTDLFFVTEGSRAKHRQKMSKLTADGKMEVLIDRSTDDAYNDPGTPLTEKNKYGRNTIKLVNGTQLFMRGIGASSKGDLPFLNSFNINTKETKQLWRCEEPYYETLTDVLDFDKLIIITNKQSQTEPPNYYVRNLSTGTAKAITAFADPQPGLRGITKQKITYKRKDGVDLAADLYLPKGYDKAKDGPLPVMMWAYPREFKSAADAAQLRGSKYTFTRVGYGSIVFWATQGYAIMDNTEFPIVGEGDKQPNDNFVDQLTWSAEAAINKIAEMGVGDSSRVAVGGHSYGAFMTANLLAHTNLFKAGIARSGAYNRTLTPFGFQNEERTYWQAPEVYFNMSPFAFADKIKTPLLMIHGEADNNPGTFPIQSERLYNAIKGHGGTVRFVQLPFEAHGYAAKENILHMLWEQHQWLEKYVKHGGKYVK
ncbi:prolyl oligopeptidase family serine peptidase [Ferruginibacter sp. SUN106]|uniref:S9 family peptidase n=1 Tax=Ferruginibacter sp. SUN106 TaxID=2978348 RepID=UPI003D364283